MTSKELKTDVFKAAFEQSLSSVVITDANLAGGGPFIIQCNEAFCRMTGYEASELIGKNPRMLQGPLTDLRLIETLKKCLVSGDFFHGSTTNYRKDGTPYEVEWNISPVYGADGQICNYVSVQMDITARVRAERDRDILAKALDTTRDLVMITDESNVILFVNRGFELLTGYKNDDVLGKTPEFLKVRAEPEEDVKKWGLISGKSDSTDHEDVVTIRNIDGETLYVLCHLAPVRSQDGMSSRTVRTGKNVTELVRERQRLQALAQTDKLTGLLNRHAGEAALNQVMQECQKGSGPLSILMADIDHFKKINDQFGHATGDRVLVKVSSLLASAVRASDYCIRWGGEEFLIALPRCPVAVASEMAERIRKQLADSTDDVVGAITLSFGVGEWTMAEPIDSLINRVDQALYEAKRSGRDRVVLSHP